MMPFGPEFSTKYRYAKRPVEPAGTDAGIVTVNIVQMFG